MSSHTSWKTHPRRGLPWIFLGLIVGVVLSTGVSVMADGDPTTDSVPRTIPYQGTLELDGRPVNASGDQGLHILFSLFDGQASETPVYTQPIIVEVFSGRFTATIGPIGQNAEGEDIVISEIVRNADDLYLGMTLLNNPNDPEDDIALSNRQRIHATPYSMWTTSATDIAIARDAQVGRNLTVTQDVNVGRDVNITRTLNVDGDVNLPTGSVDFENISSSAMTTIMGRVRDYVRSSCTIEFGWRDDCNNCSAGPAKSVTVQANNRCIAFEGSDTRCRNGNFGGVNTDGGVNDDDVFYIRFECE